jgi:hypothetical protein
MTIYQEKPNPIEVWLTQENMKVLGMAVREDESIEELLVISLSMRGAQREISGNLIKVGYKPDGRWVQEADGETWRRFRLAA